MGVLTEKRRWERKRSASALARDIGKLTDKEADNVRKAIRWLCVNANSVAAVAKKIGMTEAGLTKAKQPSRRPTARLALAVARVAGVSVDAILVGAWPGDICPLCGVKKEGSE